MHKERPAAEWLRGALCVYHFLNQRTAYCSFSTIILLAL